MASKRWATVVKQNSYLTGYVQVSNKQMYSLPFLEVGLQLLF